MIKSSMDIVKLLFEVQTQVRHMKSVTDDTTLGTRVKNGMIQVVSVTYQGNKSNVAEVSGWHPISNFQAALDEAVAARGYSATSP